MSSGPGATSGGHPRYTVDPALLPAEVQRDLVARCLVQCSHRGLTRAAVYPAGAHSARLGLDPFHRAEVGVEAFIDDSRRGSLHGRPVLPPDELPGAVQFVLISSDSIEHRCEARARAWAAQRGAEIVRPYAVFDRPGIMEADFARERAISQLLRDFNGKVNLGCGQHPLAGWTNIDGGDGAWWQAPARSEVIPLDVFDALAQLQSASCTRIYSEHFYEHFSLSDGHRMACEWARLLAPGGVVRIVMPDLEREVRMYLGERLPASPEVLDRHKRRWLGTRHREEVSRFLTPAMLLNFGMRLDGHQFIYDFATARAQLESAGFERVVRGRVGHSDHPDLCGIDRHDGGETGGDWTRDIQLVVEATRAA